MAELLWWHRVGQKVVCVETGLLRSPLGIFHDARELNIGEVYKISVVHVLNVPPPNIGFSLDGIRLRNGIRGFNSSRFRPVRETSIDCFRSLLNPTPDAKRKVFREMVEEDAR